MEYNRIRLFVDMDGTLAVFNQIDTLETLYEEGYFRDLEPHKTVVDAIKKVAFHPEIEVFILSSFLSDSQYALKEKNMWLDKYLPFINKDHRVFLPCGLKKCDFIPKGIRDTDVLFDDYTINLTDWEPPAIGVKCLNGINHTKGTWKGSRCSIEGDFEVLADKLINICVNGDVVKDQKPDMQI